MKRRVHTFGDSHALAGFEHINFDGAQDIDAYMNPHFIGSKLMYTFGQKYTEILNLGAYDIYPNDILIFCLGEIDCRCHIWKYRDNWQDIIKDLTYNYVIAIKQAIQQIADKKVYPVIYNIVPPVHENSQKENEAYPFLGTDQERLAYVRFMNQHLQVLCNIEHIDFMNIYQAYADKDGFLDPLQSDGRIHIKNKEPLINYLHTLNERT